MKKLFLFISLLFSVISHAQHTCTGPRPQINAQLIPIGTLSQTRHGVAVASAGNKILFAGGLSPNLVATNRVDIYDIATQTWTTAQLSVGRRWMASVATGNKVFFAGGTSDPSGGNPLNIVDIYDVATNTWSTASLSLPGYLMVAAAVGNKVFFAGGIGTGARSNIVDIYNLQTNSWSTIALPSARSGGHSAVTLNNKLYIAGGYGNSGTIDIYDDATNSWTTSSMLEPKYHFAGLAIGAKIYWAGGEVQQAPCGGTYTSCLVDIQDWGTGYSSTGLLANPATWFNQSEQNAVEKDGKIVFLGNRQSTNHFDIYDTLTSTWYIGQLPLSINGASIISVSNTIYLAGGEVNGVLSNQVNKLELHSVLPLSLLNFSAEVVQKTVRTKWTVENEKNTANYIVQRSPNGSDFTDIGKVKSNNTTSTHSYSFTDKNPLEAINFYRLRMEDNDGRFAYSNILMVKLSTKDGAITIYPNPAKNNTSILFNSRTKDQFSIYINDITGRLMKYTEGVSEIGANSVSIDLTGFASGIYSVSFNFQQENQSVKFYKQ